LTALHENFQPAEQNTERAAAIARQLVQYNRRFSGEPRSVST
jgi:hypothetical protein